MTRSQTVTPRRIAVPPAVAEYFWRTQLGGLVLLANRHRDAAGAVLFAIAATAVYLFTSSRERENLDYFVRLADAFLQGRLTLPEAPSWLNELIPTEGGWFVAYPPMPAILLVPVVAIFGPDVHQQVVSSVLGGVAVGLAWLVLGRFELSLRVRAFLTTVFGFGTVLWYVAEVGSVWYLAHVVALGFSLAAVLLALHGRWPLWCGLLLGCAAISRLPVGLAAPFVLALLLRIPWPPRLSAIDAATLRASLVFGFGLAIPLSGYALYNVARFGTPFDLGYSRIPGVLEDPIYVEHGILSLEYIPRNLFAIFLRSWNYVDDPPFLQPSWWGLSLFLTTPLLLWLFRSPLRDRRVGYALLGVAATAIPIVTHGNVGFIQYGYRFSLDVQALLFVMLAVVFERERLSRAAVFAGALGIVSSAYAIWAIGIDFVAF
jgi:hypothetical protein